MSVGAEPGQRPERFGGPGADSGTDPSANKRAGLSPASGWGGSIQEGPEDFQALTSVSGDMSTVSSAEGLYVYVSWASKRLFGWDPEELVGHSRDEFLHPDDLSTQRAAASSAAPGETFTTTHRFRCVDGSYRWAEATSRRVEAWGAEFVVSTVREITERLKADERVQRLALTDPLTGLANRTVLMERLREALRRQGRGGGILAVMFLDLDRFKVINDSLGHRVGDAVLRAVAGRLNRFVRGSDTLARLGGDEFVIVAEDVADEQAALELADRIGEAGREPFRVGDEEFVCTWSVGVATTADAQHSPQGLLQEADLALYRAKERGRDRTEVFDEELRTTAIGRLSTERMLRRALDEGRLRVQYQPIVDLNSGQVVSAEALVRVFDPDLGLLQPDAFIEVAEETGLLVAMDESVMVDAMDQASAWHSEFAQTDFSGVAINVTSRRLADAGFAKEVVAALDAHGLPRSYLQVEITERVLMETSHSAMTGLRALRDAGISVGLDDFGTGFSSLAYLRQFPLDFVKIDRSFVRGLTLEGDQEAIVGAIVSLAHALGLYAVAEGVEGQWQFDSLRSVGCDRAQGFLFARPVEPAVVEQLIRTGVGLGGREEI
jgi:diguanylate cyclase (GGDEF)-like protein/PAS domain S-box-containing protein